MTLEDISNVLRNTTYNTPEELACDLAEMLDQYRESVEVSINETRNRLLKESL